MLVGMDRGELDRKKRIGSVKAAIGLYGERILEGNSSLKKNPQMDFSERPSSRTREIHQARRDIGKFDGSRRVVAESIKAQAEFELANVKSAVRDLTSRIKEFNFKAKSQMRELTVANVENYQYEEVLSELEYVKQELSKLKLDMASVLEEKNRAEKETEVSNSRLSSYSSSGEALKKEIEEVNEEQVMVELARIEAVKELGVIQAQRKEEETQFSSAMLSTKDIMNNLLQEIERVKELETKLAVTTSDANMLENELKIAKEMGKSVQRNERSVMEELEATKKELASIREEASQFAASMDFIKAELKRLYEETYQMKQAEKKADVNVRTLNSKLLRAKSRLDAVSVAEIQAKTIASNLYFTHEQLKTEAEAAKKERRLIGEQVTNIKEEVEKTETEIDLAEKTFFSAMQELETVKTSESKALEDLKSLIETTMTARASTSHESLTIQISNFEYEYLAERAAKAEEIADRKVAAAQAWIEALKASEKEILMETEMGHRKIRELREEEERKGGKLEESVSLRRVIEGELRNWREKTEKSKSMPARWSRNRNSTSSAMGCMSRSGSDTLKRRRKVVPHLVKFFSSKSFERGY
ncbi:unnamed protein product [Camellia sinensis]